MDDIEEILKKGIIVTTADIKQDYHVIGPVYFQVSNKGFWSTALDRYMKKHRKGLDIIKALSQTTKEVSVGWGFLYGEFSFAMENNFDKAFFVSVMELQLRAKALGADAIVGMRQDIDLDTNHFQYFYLQMYGTAVKIK